MSCPAPGGSAPSDPPWWGVRSLGRSTFGARTAETGLVSMSSASTVARSIDEATARTW